MGNELLFRLSFAVVCLCIFNGLTSKLKPPTSDDALVTGPTIVVVALLTFLSMAKYFFL